MNAKVCVWAGLARKLGKGSGTSLDQLKLGRGQAGNPATLISETERGPLSSCNT